MVVPGISLARFSRRSALRFSQDREGEFRDTEVSGTQRRVASLFWLAPAMGNADEEVTALIKVLREPVRRSSRRLSTSRTLSTSRPTATRRETEAKLRSQIK